jgi:hypothetical protein
MKLKVPPNFQSTMASTPQSQSSQQQLCPSSYFYQTDDAIRQATYQQSVGDNTSCQITCYGILEVQNLSPYWRAKTHVLLAATEGLGMRLLNCRLLCRYWRIMRGLVSRWVNLISRQGF